MLGPSNTNRGWSATTL